MIKIAKPNFSLAETITESNVIPAVIGSYAFCLNNELVCLMKVACAKSLSVTRYGVPTNAGKFTKA